MAAIYGPDFDQSGTCNAWNSRAESPDLTAANAQIAYFEQLAADRLVQMTADAERIAELEAKNKALREALEPFAREAETFGPVFPDHLHPVCDDEPHPIYRATFTVGDLRRAATLLEKK